MSERGVTGRASLPPNEALGTTRGATGTRPPRNESALPWETRQPMRGVTGATTEPTPFDSLREAAVDARTQTAQALNDTYQTLAGQWGQGPAQPISPQAAKALHAYIKNDLIPAMQAYKQAGIKYATDRRDMALHNYSDRRNIDALLYNVAPYGFWASRSLPKWALRIAEHPEALQLGLRAWRALQEQNKDLPPAYRQGFNVKPALQATLGRVLPMNDDPLYANIMNLAIPLYGLVNAFDDREKSATPYGQVIQGMQNAGFAPWAPLIWALGAGLAASGKGDEARHYVGSLGPTTKAIKNLTALAGAKGVPGFERLPQINSGQGITPDPNLWLTDQGKFTLGQGLDYWSQRRLARVFGTMVDQGRLTQEQADEAIHTQSGPYWAKAVGELMQGQPGQPMTGLALPGLIGGILGPGFKARTQAYVEMEQADADWATLMQNKKAGQTPEEWTSARNAFQAKYPFYSAVLSGRKTGTDSADTSFAYSVLGRLPPQGAGRQLREAAGLPADLLDRFYAAKGDMSDWTPVDKQTLMLAVQKLSQTVATPTPELKQQYQQAKDANAGLYELRDTQFPGVDAIETQYFALPQGSQARRDLLKANPRLKAWWDAKNAYQQAHPEVKTYATTGTAAAGPNPEAQFWGGITQKYGPDIQANSKQYISIRDTQGPEAARNFLALHPTLKPYWDEVRTFYAQQPGGTGATTAPPAWGRYSAGAPQKINWVGHGERMSGYKRGGGGGGYSSAKKKKAVTAYGSPLAWKWGPINWRYGMMRPGG
jgi:hypothetical protein